MSCSENDDDTIMSSKEQPDSSSTDDGTYGDSTAEGGSVVLKKGPWTSEEDALLISYVQNHGEGNWNAAQRLSGLLRCGKSCRLRWANHLRPHLKKGALSPEEEQFIIQMHSKMGNRWARMAALLPGRTDNEIKNYWNTRVKRRQRAGLPVYPPKVNVQASNESQPFQCAGDFSSNNQQNIDVFPGAMHEIMEFNFHPYKTNPGPLSHIPSLPEVFITGLPTHGLGCYARSFLNPGWNQAKQAREESEASFPSSPASEPHLSMNSRKKIVNSGSAYLSNVYPNSNGIASFTCSMLCNPALSNGNPHSSRPPTGTVKMELPSLQYSEAGYVDCNYFSSFSSSYDAADAYSHSPENVSVSVQSGCISPRNNGLLEDLVHESHAIRHSYERSFENAYISAAMLGSSTAKWEEIKDPTSPFCLSTMSLFSENHPIVRSNLDEFSAHESPMCPGATMPNAELISALNVPDTSVRNALDFHRPDALLGSGRFIGSFQSAVDAISTPLSEDLPEVCGPILAGAASTGSMESYPWTNMPRACQISEF